MEEWRPVVGYESAYEVSNLGRIRRIGVPLHSRLKLSLEDIVLIRQARESGEPFHTIAKRFGTSKSTIMLALKPKKFSFRTPYRLLKPQLNMHGYPSVMLCVNGKAKAHRIHNMMAKAFIGEIPPGFVTNHKNGIKHDNRLENLEILSHGDNTRHSVFVLGKKAPGAKKGTRNHMAKFQESDIVTIRSLHAAGMAYTEIARHFHVDPSTIRRIDIRQTWKHVP